MLACRLLPYETTAPPYIITHPEVELLICQSLKGVDPEFPRSLGHLPNAMLGRFRFG